MFGKKSFIAAFILMPVLALADLASDWENAPMGIVITNCVYDTYGVSVQFETDLEPPYIVGVYESWEDGLGRNFPVAETTTDSKHAFVAGDFTDVTTFVEVMKPSRYTRGMPRRLLSAYEKKMYRDDLMHREVLRTSPEQERVFADINWAPDNVMGQVKGMELITDHTWTGIIHSNDTDPEFSFKGKTAVDNVVTGQVFMFVQEEYWHLREFPRQDWVLVSCKTNETIGAIGVTEAKSGTSIYGPYEKPCKYTSIKRFWALIPTGKNVEYTDGHKLIDVEMQPFSIHATEEQASRGTGWRVVFNDESGETLAMRAYSARTNCSNTVYLPRLFLGLNAHDGYRLTTDQNGIVICVPDKNSPNNEE